MTSKEAILGSLVTDEIKSLSGSLDFWGKHIEIPNEESWLPKGHLTLDKFLDEHPAPSNPTEVPLYGIAWELTWGKKPPEEITEARQTLLLRNRLGLPVNETEKIWLKLISVDAELF